MPPPLFADRNAPPPERGMVDALITQTRRLRGEVDAVRQDAAADEDDTLWRWQRALCDLAVHQLDDLGAHLDQLRAGRPSGAEGAGDVEGAPLPGPLTGRVGSAEWNLLTDEASWSDELFDILDRPRSSGPMSLDELPSLVFFEDRALLTTMVTACLVDGRPIDGEFRVVHHDGQVRTVHMMGEPVLDGSGCTASMWAVVRDVSDLRRGERAVRASGASVARDRGPASPRERARVAATFEDTTAPATRYAPAGSSRPAGPAALDVAAYCPRGARGTPLGGDWCDVFELPGEPPAGDTLLAVGGLTGHGAYADSSIAMVRGALRGLSVAGIEPGPLLGHLDRLIDAQEQPTLSSALCSRYRPSTRTFSWAQAGHPAPLLFRDGTGRALTRPDGVLLGATPGASYEQADVRLLPGDVLVLRTEALAPGADARLLSLAPALTAAGSAQECAALVAAEFDGPRTPRTDDACVLVARAT
ncbi:SpoIIE family protein phosphatase [Streptomyces sp. 8L]|uniref:SpoIIE family protein phosphatase n=1 Tax=Streptomyces sp. 8L TaxID=2877242 RepID=UPI001CD39660|nr:SpoIIE family protein phosphatase [Streptomyces sp. 8L]MCA1221630.1 SpoIIE family protein phosphatase [Streptomyces sp. 8L]